MADESSSLFPGGRRIANANLPLGAQLYDTGTPIIAADFGARSLARNDGATILSWDSGDGFLVFGNAGVVFSAIDGVGNDSSSVLAINWTNRQLIANDGSTVALDWSEPDFVSLFGSVIINANGDINGGNFSGRAAGISDGSRIFDIVTDGLQPTTNLTYKSADGATYFDNSGFHGVGSVIAGTKTATGTATTTFAVTIGVTMANTTYKVTTEGDNALSAAVRYVTNKTTTTFDVVYLAGLTGAVSFDWMVSP